MNTLFRFSKPLLQGVSVRSWPFSTFLFSGSIAGNKMGSSHRIGVAGQLDLPIALTHAHYSFRLILAVFGELTL
jgi:hypothetical protein